jgi:hypothetical protein
MASRRYLAYGVSKEGITGMKRRWVLLAGAGLSFGGLTVVACSGSSGNQAQSNTEPEGGPDSTTGDDAAHPSDDSSSPPPPVDSGGHEASTSTDAGSDGGDGGDGGSCVPFDASALDDASVAAGFQQVWHVYRCYGCHQPSSDMVSDAGAGIVLSGNNAGLGDSGTIFPPNLTGDPATGLGCWTDSQISNAILNGVDDQGRTLCKPMPKFGQPKPTADGGATPGYPMDAGTAQEIIDYLRSLPVVVNKVTDTTCPSPDAGPADAGPADAAEQ